MISYIKYFHLKTSGPYPAQYTNSRPEMSMEGLIGAPVWYPNAIRIPYNKNANANGIKPEAVLALFGSISIHTVLVTRPHPVN